MLDTETRKKRFRQLNQYQEDNEEEQESVWDLSDESTDDGFEIPLVTESQGEDYVTNESILDPETGLLYKYTEESPVGCESPTDNFILADKSADLKTELVSSSRQLEESADSEEISNMKWGVLDGDDQIFQYIHKKFGKKKELEEPGDALTENESILDIAFLSQSEDGLRLQLSLKKKPTETRKSVIVERQDYDQKNSI